MNEPAVSPADPRATGRRRLTRLPRQPAAKGTTVDRVTEVLIDHIRRHRLAAGSPLPSEVQMSAELGVSRGAVREAYRSLSQSGMVNVANGRPPRVGEISNRALLQLVQHALWTQQVSPEEILDLRSAIDERAAALAATHRTSADVVRLRRAVASMKGAGLRPGPYVKADIQFHETIGRATGNPLIGLMSSGLREAMGTSIRVSLAGRQSQAELARVIDTHAKIVDAIEAQRPRDARRLMERHFDEARAAVRRITAPDGDAAVGPAPRPRRRRA
ncbi:MAG: FadR family transcriptional regulator [Acidobacteria bacterium]|nr:FadR family transcriptional regulator [Acidobacteriota bacterium]